MLAAAVWLAVSCLENAWLGEHLAVTVSSGIRFLVLLTLGLPGLAAISIASFVDMLAGTGPTAAGLTSASMAAVTLGLLPYLALATAKRLFDVQENLGNLRTAHLYMLGGADSLTVGIAATIAAIASGTFVHAAPLEILARTGTLMAGNFLGIMLCLSAILVALKALKAGRIAKSGMRR